MFSAHLRAESAEGVRLTAALSIAFPERVSA